MIGVLSLAACLAVTPMAPTTLPQARTPKTGDEVAVMETDKGRIVLMFFPDKAPKHVENFKTLAKAGFYDGTRFHRCIPKFMIQGGDPNTKDLAKADLWGTGGATKADGERQLVKAEFNDTKHVRGILSMARASDPNSASSQFFIMHADSPHLDGQYSAFGEVVTGFDVVDLIVKTGEGGANGKVEAKNAVVIKSVKIVTWPIEKEEQFSWR